MANRVKRFIESVVYAGLKPSGPAQEPRREPPGPLRDKIERFLSGGRPPSDPLYLSNRTWQHSLKLGLGIAVPAALLSGALALVLTHVFAPAARPPKEASAKEIMAKLLPDLEKTVRIDPYKDAELLQLRVRRDGPPALMGLLRNNTDHVISVEFRADLANLDGLRVASIVRRVEKIPPGAPVTFEFPLDSRGAATALVRSVRTVQ